MPRTARASDAGYCCHVLSRGNARATVFHKEADDHAFLEMMDEASLRIPMRIIAYYLMPNRFHMVLWPRDDGDDHLRTVLRSIERSLLRAHLMERAESWRWSSL